MPSNLKSYTSWLLLTTVSPSISSFPLGFEIYLHVPFFTNAGSPVTAFSLIFASSELDLDGQAKQVPRQVYSSLAGAYLDGHS